MNEEWKPVLGYGVFGENYEVSDLGCVRSVDRVITDSAGRSYTRRGQDISICEDGRGYATVILWHSGRRKQVNVHRLVAFAFITKPPDKDQVNHLNGNRLDNRVENLEWCSGSESMRHAFETGIWVPSSGDEHYKRREARGYEDRSAG